MLKKFIKAQKTQNMVWCQSKKMSGKRCFFCSLLSLLGSFRGSNPKVMGTVESDSLRHFIWYLGQSNQIYGYVNINYC